MVNKHKNQDIIRLFLSVVIVLLIAFVSQRAFFRIDFTSEKRFTLSDKTKEILKGIDEVVFIKVYLDGDMPAGFKKFRNAIQETLDEFKIYGGDNIQYEFIDPAESTNAEVRYKIFNELVDKGLKPNDIQVNEKDGQKSEKTLFPGAIINYKGIEYPVSFLKNSAILTAEENLNNSIQNIEYQLVKSIFILTNQKVEKVAFLEGHGELNEMETGDITHELSNYFEVDRGTINGNPEILANYKAVIIARPTKPFSESDKFILDQYVMNGGKLIWFLDGVQVNSDSLANGSSLALANSLNIEDLLFTYGVRVNPNLVKDIQCNTLPVQAGMDGNQPKWVQAPWLYYPLLSPLVMHPVTRDLNLIFARFASTIDTVGANNALVKTVLLRTSSFTQVVNAPLFVRLAEVKQTPQKEQFNMPNQAIAVLLEGEFSSVFRNRNAKDILPDANITLKTKSVPTKMMVIADGDLIANDVRITPKGPMITALGYDKYTRQTFGNKEFIVNAISYLTDENNLLSLRSKEYKLRILDRARIGNERLKWQIINVLLPVLLVVVFGIVYQFRRKRKYTFHT